MKKVEQQEQAQLKLLLRRIERLVEEYSLNALRCIKGVELELINDSISKLKALCSQN